MAENCKTCGKFLKNPNLTHCSDACLLQSIASSTSVTETGINAVTWDDKTDPWV